ncbi:MAG: hypothetical protein CNE95_04875 [Puniceicoccaceae bacterium MED-G30]|jgi:hypothetical protein|nr:MAG: hypothetical protein CNE95_04875 [Puniceicoccaceae bacterium MED-G30]RPG83865.1 MAG: hypothetical protein CBC33_008060 [Coraliomargarita sp. TMED73]RPG87229.1 MAG: hypothetical protein CBC33_000805 [Coraliomargarita sp. TMED73]|tara:strand:+ start:13405 stop:13653 length:249 start_codon:yes stop_codon:yes gene_type:complete
MQECVHQKLLGKTQIAIGIIAALGMFALMSKCLLPYTFSDDKMIAQLQACLAATPIATTFWFAVNMFMIVLADQRRQKKSTD